MCFKRAERVCNVLRYKITPAYDCSFCAIDGAGFALWACGEFQFAYQARMPRRVTMSDVAKKAGVHQTTVSLALRDHPRIPEATRLRIRETAQEMGYRANPFVSAFVAWRNRRGRARQAVLGYISADAPQHGGHDAVKKSYSDLYTGAQERAEELGYGLEHFWLGDPRLTRQRFNQITSTRNIHGLLLAPLTVHSVTLNVDWDRFSVVAYGYSMQEPHVHRVYPDFYHGILDALRRCRAAGYQRVGLVLDENTDRKSDHLWLSGYLMEQRMTQGAAKIEPLLMRGWDEGAFTTWHARYRPQVVLGLNVILESARIWARDRGPVQARKLRFVLLNVTNLDAPEKFPGVLLDRMRVGAACVDQIVGMIHRNEKGVPARAQHLLVESGWVDPEGIFEATGV
jgi:DNA-binding LacI/PurR family transcriptional regulator